MSKKKYSVIIPIYNGACRIGITIESLLRQTIPSKDFEIIIVDDASSDNVGEIITYYQKTYPQYEIHHIKLPENRGPATARNKGIDFASGSILFFTDDDCEVPALWIETHAKVYEDHPEIVAVGGWYNPLRRNLLTNLYLFFIYINQRAVFLFSLDTFEGTNAQFKNEELFPAINTANFSVKRWVPRVVGGFDERFRHVGSEDYEFSRRIREKKYLIYYLPFMVTHHKTLNLKGLIRMAVNRVKGVVAHTYFIGLQKNIYYEPYNKSFFSMWRKFISYVKNIHPKRSGVYYFTPKLLLISFIYFFIYYSQISRSYYKRKLKLRAR